MADKYNPPPKQFDNDLRHWGEMCERLRSARLVDEITLAYMCEVSPTTIYRTLEENGGMNRTNFEKYISILKDKGRFPLALTENQARMIEYYYAHRHSKARIKQDCDLAHINFNHIREAKRKPNECDRLLVKLIEELEKEHRPALIMDSLWFDHAVNGSLLNLFELEPNDDIFKQWYGWHSIGIKAPHNSQVRQKYPNTDSFLPQTLRYFFEYEHTYPHLFTVQFRYLLSQLHTLSTDEDYELQKWWAQIISFNLPYKLRAVPRKIMCQGRTYDFNPINTRSVVVTVEGGHKVRYILSIFDPDSEEAEAIRTQIEDHTLYVAADFEDKAQQKFHVNDLPEVAAFINALPCE